MTDEVFIQEAQDLIRQVVEADTNNFLELAEIAGLDARTDLAGADLSGFDLRSADLRDADLSYTEVENARFGYNEGISEDMKHDLIARGAIFEDSPPPGDRSRVLVGV